MLNTHNRMLDTIQRCMRQTGIKPLESHVGSRCVTYKLPAYGDTFIASVGSGNGSDVLVMVYSNIEFKPGRVPRPLLGFMEDRNKSLPRFDYCLTDADGDEQQFYLVARTRASSFDAELLSQALQEMLTEISAFDELLTGRGYVR